MTEQEKSAVLRLWGLEKLEQATRHTWPSQWWSWKADKPYGRFWAEDLEPRMPDFHGDDAAAVVLAEKLGVIIWSPNSITKLWRVARGPIAEGLTLGSALLAALVASQS